MWIDFDTMESFMVDVFKGLGVPEEDARKLRTRFIGRLTEGMKQVLKELIEIKRQKDILWAI